MNGPERTNGPDPIREMINVEERAALARFRDSRFGDRLKARLGDRRAAPVRPAAARPALRPVWVSLAVLATAAAAAILLLKPFSRPLSGRLAVAAALHRSPGLQAIEAGTVPSGDSPRPGASPGAGAQAGPLGKDFASVLSVLRAAGVSPSSGRNRGFSTIEPAAKPLGLQRVYEILVIDRSVERVLTDVSTKTKEG